MDNSMDNTPPRLSSNHYWLRPWKLLEHHGRWCRTTWRQDAFRHAGCFRMLAMMSLEIDIVFSSALAAATRW